VPSHDLSALLNEAADQIANMPRPDLQILLRRAALMLRDAGAIALDEQVDEAIACIADELGKTRNDMIRYIIQEWLETNACLPVRELDEDGEVDGSA
jgi:hypothetical protein